MVEQFCYLPTALLPSPLDTCDDDTMLDAVAVAEDEVVEVTDGHPPTQ